MRDVSELPSGLRAEVERLTLAEHFPASKTIPVSSTTSAPSPSRTTYLLIVAADVLYNISSSAVPAPTIQVTLLITATQQGKLLDWTTSSASSREVETPES